MSVTHRLYLLPFDHRASYLSGLFGFKPPLSADQQATVEDSKRLIYEGFLAALASGAVAADSAGILVDEAFGASVLRDARQRGIVTAMPVESSGSDEFQFEEGDDFAAHLAAFQPTYAKALVRYNAEGDAALNQRQTGRLQRLSEHCRAAGQRWMFELLVPATAAQLAQVGGDKARFDRELRPGLMQAAVRALQDAGVEPDVWKVEGLDSADDARALVALAQRDGRAAVGCIVLGRGADEAQVLAWLRIAAGVPGFIGFAVGRTSFWDPVVAFEAGRLARPAAAAQIAERFREWVEVFERARAG